MPKLPAPAARPQVKPRPAAVTPRAVECREMDDCHAEVPSYLSALYEEQEVRCEAPRYSRPD